MNVNINILLDNFNRKVVFYIKKQTDSTVVTVVSLGSERQIQRGEEACLIFIK